MNLSKITCCIFLTFLIFQSCKKSQKSIDFTNTSIVNTDNEKWVKFVNQKSDSLTTMYVDDAIKILSDGKTIIGNHDIKEFLISNHISIQSIKSDTVILANKKRGLQYEMGEFIVDENEKYKLIVIWESKENKRQRVFEFNVRVKETSQDLSAIDQRRKSWMELCNAHNASALINELYSPNTMYFNHKPLIIGRDALILDYQYMNNDKYKLTLIPIITEKINDDFVFEIGQCKGSYNGKYIIVWRKNASGKWEVFIDSNI